MDESTVSIALLRGAGNETLDLKAFVTAGEETKHIHQICYPGWRRYIASDFSVDDFIRELAEEVANRTRSSRIGVVGYSLGGHLGYLAALRLQEMGVTVVGLCAIDSLMVHTADLRPGWISRFLEAALPDVRNRSVSKVLLLARRQYWRGLMRLTGARAPALLRILRNHSRVIAALGPIFDQEVSMRLLLRAIAPQLGMLDRAPPPLTAPTFLFRTDINRGDDLAWRRRCPNLQIIDLPGNHNTLFDAQHVDAFRNSFLEITSDWR